MKKTQWLYLRYWIILVVIAEAIMFIFNQDLDTIYLIIAWAFCIGLILRILKFYPGKREPFILDFLGLIIGFIFAYMARLLALSNFRFLLILFSSLIVMPHLIYIISNEATTYGA